MPDFRAHKKLANFFGGGFDRRCGEFGKIFWATCDQFLKLLEVPIAHNSH
ncbi:hypothetical protein [Microcoleus sp.]